MKEILIYTRTSEPQSERMIKYLNDHQIEFHNKNVDDNKQATEDLLRDTNQLQTPAMVVREDDGDEVIMGFNLE